MSPILDSIGGARAFGWGAAPSELIVDYLVVAG